MNRFLNTTRIYALFGVIALLLMIYVARLYSLQLRGGEVDEVLANATTTRETVESARGDLLDRNGTPLVTTSVSYGVSLSRDALLEIPNRNDVILEIVRLAEQYGVKYTDTFPVTKTAPLTYIEDMSDHQRYLLDSYLEFFDLDPDIAAQDLIVWMKDHYGLDYTTPLTDTRLIIGVRYELEIRVIVNVDPYVFAENAGTEFVSILGEKGLPGVSVVRSSERVLCTDRAAHLLGYLGKITPEQEETYRALGYPMDADIGQSGAEAAFEQYLHGVDGERRVLLSEEGSVISTETIKEAQPGDNVYLSIDIGLQAAAEDALKKTVDYLNGNRARSDAVTGAAVAVLEVGTSEALAVASYPTFDLSTFLENYTSLINDPMNPVLNRATENYYSPGSTFKMCTALAGLRAGTIDRWSTVYDPGYYDVYAYAGYEPVCWVYPGGHGDLDVVGALKNSCNVFFYWLGDHTGINNIAAAARDFGFGQHTGIEIGDIEGIVACQEYKEETFGEEWYAGDTLLASIGQSYNLFTPIQLANYAATIADGGTRYAVTMLHSVKNSDYTAVKLEKEPEVRYQFKGKDLEYISYLQDGMKAVVEPDGTAGSMFADYDVPIAAKTGTVQSDADVVNNGVFVCYAPADDPEIAIAVVVEKGGSGSNIMSVAKDILDAYFGRTVKTAIISDGVLIR